MTVAEFPSQPGPDFDRTPPQDIAAEQCVLGGMLLSKDAIADVVEVLREHDFYRPAHALVYDAVLDLYGKGEPADPVTVAAELTRRGELGRVGGAPYLHTLISSVPTAANAGYYARIVRERAILRRLVEAGTRIVQLGYTGEGGDVDNVVDAAQAEVYSVTDKRTSEDYQPLSAIMQGALDEIEAIGSRDGEMIGVPTGFADLDSLTNGLHPGQMIIIAARPALGKALALDTPLPTPQGWTTMADVAVGDEVLGADGRPTTVVAATEVMYGRECHEVEFDDGTIVVADGQHRWLTESRGVVQVRTTEQVAASLHRSRGRMRSNHAVSNTAPLRLQRRDLPLSPYTLGVWLGTGQGVSASSASASKAVPAPADPEIGMHVAAEAREDVQAVLEQMGVLHDRHVPLGYLRASETQRRALLAGLLDVAGTVRADGTVQLTSTNARLAGDVRELVLGLGFRCELAREGVDLRSDTISFTLTVGTDDDVFRLESKRLAHKERRGRQARRWARRYVTAVRRVGSVPVRCIQVDNEQHLYLAGHGFVPTHNSTLGLDLVRSASVKHGLTSVIFSLEMSRNEITMRLLSAEARVALHHMRSGTMTDEDWTRLARRMSEVAEAPLFIDDSPNMTMMEIRAKCRRLKQRHDLRLVVVDYLQLMTSGRRVESRQQEVSEFSRSLKLLAKELEVPVVAIAQLNRGPEQRTDKRPLLADLRESGSLEQDSDMVVLLHREDAYEKESPRAGEADLIVAKHRNGPTATITVAFQGHYSRFVDMAQG